MDLTARIREMSRAGKPVGIALTMTESGWVAACSDGSIFVFHSGRGEGGTWIEQVPVPRTPTASAEGE